MLKERIGTSDGLINKAADASLEMLSDLLKYDVTRTSVRSEAAQGHAS